MITNQNQFECAHHHITSIVLTSSRCACRTWNGQKQNFPRQDFIFISAVWRFAHTHPCTNMASTACAHIMHPDIARCCHRVRLVCVHMHGVFSRVNQIDYFYPHLTVHVLEMWYCVLTPHAQVASIVASPTLLLLTF